MKNSLWREQILPFAGLLVLLALATVLGDYLLHRFKLVWIGRYIGIAGTLLIVASLYYSLRKRRYVTAGHPKTMLTLHETLAWLGSALVLVHAGIHFNAILPWLATVAMGVNVVSGLVGRVLLQRSQRHMRQEHERYQQQGLSPADIERALFWDAVAVRAMAQWRAVHIPIFVAFAALSLGHIVGIFLFWGWV